MQLWILTGRVAGTRCVYTAGMFNANARLTRGHSSWVLMIAVGVMVGCATPPPNPSFAVEVHQAREAIKQMQGEPKRLARPVVLLPGWLDPGLAPLILECTIQPAVTGERIVTPSFVFAFTFDQLRDRVIEAVDEAVPSDDPLWTAEVDVVAVSMGGLVARYAAAEVEGKRRLRIGRLLTISTPHRGAAMARVPWPDPLAIDMRPGSAFLRRLDAAWPDRRYKVVPYARLGDRIVGIENTAPPGHRPWWVPNEAFEFAHLNASTDPRIVADIMRRLRQEPPLTTWPKTAAPPAGGDDS